MDELSKTRLAEITAKSQADLTEADAAFLRARRSYLTEEQCAVYADALRGVELTEAAAAAPAEDQSESAPKKKAPK
jgi:hypothetical protein